MTENASLLDALGLAMAAEQRAAQFYQDAANKAQSPRGKNLLQQLADFETAHYRALEDQRKSLAAGAAPVEYAGKEFEPVPTEVTSKAGSKESNLESVYEVLKLAIDAETGAHDGLSELAEKAEDATLRDFFTKLAAEETLHRRILSDEFYQLKNSGGEWTWME